MIGGGVPPNQTQTQMQSVSYEEERAAATPTEQLQTLEETRRASDEEEGGECVEGCGGEL